MGSKVVCVTGASGFIASWLVKLLLQRGYVVRATVRDLGNPEKTEHLRALEGAQERLQLYKANLLEEGSFDAAIDCCEGVFHMASPCYSSVIDPQVELIDPAVKGTLNVLNACAKASSVKRVVITSSVAAVLYNSRPRSPGVIDETWFSDPEYCKQTKSWYPLSKTLAEEAAWKFSHQNGIDVVTIHPAMVIGPLLQPTLNGSSMVIQNLMNGASTYQNFAYGWVGVRDVAEAHILAFEEPTANGRYILVERTADLEETGKLLSKLYPGHSLPNKCADENPLSRPYVASKEKAHKLGLKFTPFEEILRETVESLKAHKFLTLDSNP